MAGLVRALFGGRSRPPDPDPLPGQGGVQLPPGPAGETGFPGSTSSTRTFPGLNQRRAKVLSDSNTGWESGPGSTTWVQQSSYRGDEPASSPRRTPTTSVPRGVLRENMQDIPATLKGGPTMHTTNGNDTAGGTPQREAQAVGGHDVKDTETPEPQRHPTIARGIPGSNNVRNTIAQKYHNPPGDMHTYRSASRSDQARIMRSGHERSTTLDEKTTMVTVPNRFIRPGGGFETYYMLRRMPYTSVGDGSRGAHLNGTRLYATGQEHQFGNAGSGNYGIARERGGKRPVSFTEPAPWSTNFYDTTNDVGTTDAPGTPTQAPQMVYISPSTGRARNDTGRTG